MAKEMMIVFVYDTQACTAEEDDPADAVLYFHPGWVSDTQRHALAGQVVGAAHCVKSLFSQPLSISLQSGKFILREYGRYILAIGSDRNIPEWVLNSRAALLTSMIRVYHGDLAAAAALVPAGSRVADKFYQMLETYLPVLQYGAHIFQRVPILHPPKNATSVFLESSQILDHCLRFKGVLGGIILYNNKIIASQLPPGLTSYLTVVDPYRIKSPAEPVGGVALPLGAQLLRVFVGRRTCAALRRRARLIREAGEDAAALLAQCKKNQEAEREKQSTGNFPTGGMKRDKSLLFTAVPEEDHNMISPPVQDNRTESEQQRKLPNIPDVVPFTNKPRTRPNKLSLSLKTQKSIDEDAIEEKVFTGQTSVCSTPMVEYKRLHGNVLSICQNPDNQPDKTDPDIVKNTDSSTNAKLIEFEQQENRMVFEFNTIGDHYINKPEPIRKQASVIDIQDTFKRLSDRATAKFKLKRETISEEASPERNSKKNVSTVTINDPSFPVFRNDGFEISESLFKQYLEQHYASMKRDLSTEDNMFTYNKKLAEQDKFEGFDSEFTRSPQRTPKKMAKEIKPLNQTDQSKSQSNQTDHSKPQSDQSRRKSLSLPLKSLSESEQTDTESTSFKKKLSGVQLTPLMEKLSHLAFSDKSSGYGSRVMTPLELREFTPATDRMASFSQDKSKPLKQDSYDDDEVSTDELWDYSTRAEPCGLLVSGLQSMALLALVDLDQLAPETPLQLWETSLNALGPIEQKCMEPFPAAAEPSDYSYLVLDPDWGTVKRGGPWASLDIAAMGLIHSEMFSEDPDLSELTLRSEESVVLGQRCGGCEVYYAEASTRAAGVPAPQDALPAASARAQRRLARDHAVVLL